VFSLVGVRFSIVGVRLELAKPPLEPKNEGKMKMIPELEEGL
jgi:hypothetical protein